jgi:hypothetical protein
MSAGVGLMYDSNSIIVASEMILQQSSLELGCQKE